MAKIKLGNRPKAFKHRIKITLPEGGEGSVEMLYKYKTRTEFGEFLDEVLAEAKVVAASSSGVDMEASLKEALEKTVDQNADYILRIAEGWDLEYEFDRERIAQMCDELPGAALEIINAYRLACTEGRLGN